MIFALGDRGVHAQGVAPGPQDVTAKMVGNFLAGGAAISVLARQAGAARRLGYMFVLKLDEGQLLNGSLYCGLQATRNGDCSWFREALTDLPASGHDKRRALAGGRRG
jgi:NaMN:DMB phosphoribosyltransferase